MFTKRIIPCLDVNAGRVVKGVNFVDLQDAGDPVEIAKAYDKAGADELVFLDITASSDNRETVTDMVRKVAECVFIPFTVGGGIRTVDDFRAILREGADKVSVNVPTVFEDERDGLLRMKEDMKNKAIYIENNIMQLQEKRQIVDNAELICSVAENHKMVLVANIEREIASSKKSFNLKYGKIKTENILSCNL